MSADCTDDVDPITRQLGEYWAAWGRAMNDSLGRGNPSGTGFGNPGMGAGFEAGGPWMAAIHQLACMALERGLDSAGIAAAWRKILQDNGLWPNWPKPDPAQARAAEQLFAPWLDSPAFGPAREHFSRWQTLARQQFDALAEGAPLGQAIDAMMEAAIAGFEQRLRQREIDGKPLESARALFDLWIEAAEQAWEDMASGEVFARASAQASQAQLQLQRSAQAELARFCQAIGLPTRSEVDQVHQRIVALERELDRLRAVVDGRVAAADAANPVKKTAKKQPAKQAASSKLAGKPAAARTTSSRSSSEGASGKAVAARSKAAARKGAKIAKSASVAKAAGSPKARKAHA